MRIVRRWWPMAEDRLSYMCCYSWRLQGCRLRNCWQFRNRLRRLHCICRMFLLQCWWLWCLLDIGGCTPCCAWKSLWCSWGKPTLMYSLDRGFSIRHTIRVHWGSIVWDSWQDMFQLSMRSCSGTLLWHHYSRFGSLLRKSNKFCTEGCTVSIQEFACLSKIHRGILRSISFGMVNSMFM